MLATIGRHAYTDALGVSLRITLYVVNLMLVSLVCIKPILHCAALIYEVYVKRLFVNRIVTLDTGRPQTWFYVGLDW